MRLAPLSRSRASSCWETRGRAQVQRVGGGGHAAVRGDRLQHAQPAGINHSEALLSLYGR